MTTFARGPARHRRGDALRREPAAGARRRRRVHAQRPARRRRVDAFGAGWANDALARGGRARRIAVVPAGRRRSPTSTPRWPTRTTGGASASTRSSTTRRTTACSPRRSRAARTRPRGRTRGRGRDVARAAMFMLFAQVEPGHACPVSMTHAAVASIKDSPWVADEWLPRHVLARVRAAPAPERGEAQRAHRHGDDREAGRIGRPGRHDRGHVDGRPRVPAHRPQVVLLGADVGRLPRARAHAPRATSTRGSRASSCRGCCRTACATCSASSG